jgi:hypothetical protein
MCGWRQLHDNGLASADYAESLVANLWCLEEYDGVVRPLASNKGPRRSLSLRHDFR